MKGQGFGFLNPVVSLMISRCQVFRPVALAPSDHWMSRYVQLLSDDSLLIALVPAVLHEPECSTPEGISLVTVTPKSVDDLDGQPFRQVFTSFALLYGIVDEPRYSAAERRSYSMNLFRSPFHDQALREAYILVAFCFRGFFPVSSWRGDSAY